jgi:CRP-like cAMP-binding protein
MSLLADLQSIKLLSDLDETKLKKIEKITSVVTYREGDYIFRENEYADYLYSVISGKVALELALDSSNRCRVKDVFPGETCGISSVVDTGKRTYIAEGIAVQDSRMFRWKGSDLEKLFYQDYETGFIFMRNLGKILKKRLQYTRAQLVSGIYAAESQSP